MTHHTFTNRLTRLAVTGAIALPLILGAAACGDDDDAAADDAAPTTVAQADGASSNTAFCDGFVAVDAALGALMGGDGPPDPAALDEVRTKVEAARDAAPDDVADTVASLADQTLDRLESPDGGPSEEFDATYGEVISWIDDNCGFGSLDVTAMDFHYMGIPEEVDAGKTTVHLANEGKELHEMIIFRIADDVTAPVEDLLQLPEEEMGGKIEPKGMVFAMPGAKSATTVDLEPGRYAVICFIPVGTTPEAMEQAGPNSAPPEGPPHFSQGMVHEMTVA